jgi:hypothetical protein
VNGAQLAVVVHATKQVFVPALFLMQKVLPGQSTDLVQGFVHQKPLQVPVLVPEPQAAPDVLHGLPIPPPLPAAPPTPPVPPVPSQNSGNAQALLPLSSVAQQLLPHSELVVQREAQNAPRSGKFTHEARLAENSQHSLLAAHCLVLAVGMQPPEPPLPAVPAEVPAEPAAVPPAPPVPAPAAPPDDGVDSSTS